MRKKAGFFTSAFFDTKSGSFLDLDFTIAYWGATGSS
jgi:hypothetical protein